MPLSYPKGRPLSTNYPATIGCKGGIRAQLEKAGRGNIITHGRLPGMKFVTFDTGKMDVLPGQTLLQNHFRRIVLLILLLLTALLSEPFP